MADDLWKEIQYTLKTLKKGTVELRERGQAKAKAECEYRKALSKRLLELRASGSPVTHLADIARGEPEIAELKQTRDIAESLYQSCIEGINVYKLEVRILEGQFEREWNQAGRD